jgi:hypothetical protein
MNADQPAWSMSPENRAALVALLDELNADIERDKNRWSQRLLRLFLDRKR